MTTTLGVFVFRGWGVGSVSVAGISLFFWSLGWVGVGVSVVLLGLVPHLRL